MRIRNVALLILILPLLSGCASIASSILQSVGDSIECHHKCPGGSPKEEEQCREKCLAELSAKRECSRREKEKAEAEKKQREWEETTRKQLEALNKNQRGILE